MALIGNWSEAVSAWPVSGVHPSHPMISWCWCISPKLRHPQQILTAPRNIISTSCFKLQGSKARKMSSWGTCLLKTSSDNILKAWQSVAVFLSPNSHCLLIFGLLCWLTVPDDVFLYPNPSFFIVTRTYTQQVPYFGLPPSSWCHKYTACLLSWCQKSHHI